VLARLAIRKLAFSAYFYIGGRRNSWEHKRKGKYLRERSKKGRLVRVSGAYVRYNHITAGTLRSWHQPRSVPRASSNSISMGSGGLRFAEIEKRL
jgi:hypothetical protein